MSKKHHMTKYQYNSQKKHRRPVNRRRDVEDEAAQNARVSHGRLRERNLATATDRIQSIKDVEEDFFSDDMVQNELSV